MAGFFKRGVSLLALSAAAVLVPAVAGQAAAVTPPPGATVPMTPCKATKGLGGLCGRLNVPLDYAHPEQGTITVAFIWFPRGDRSRPSLGTLVPNDGGPGQSTASDPIGWYKLFGSVLKRYDLLLIDDRGRGSSSVIDCPATQHGTGDYFAGIAACGAQLGAAADKYGTAAVADDADAIRAALGIDKITYYGLSYGGVDVEAYATRHGEHLAAVVGDAPWTSLVDPMQREIAPATVRDVVRSCSYAPGCSARNPKPYATLRWLAQRLARKPLVGTGIDFAGKPYKVRLDEASMMNRLAHNSSGWGGDYLARTGGGFATAGELTAAARALKRGDRRPLLRLAAEQLSGYSFPGDTGPATEFSQGAYFATFCTDSLALYDTTAPVDVRRAQYEAALDAMPKDTFAPFSVRGYEKFLREALYAADACIYWPAPRKDVLAADASYPSVPALILNGDLDATDPSEYSVDYTKRWPRGQFVEVAGAGHGVLLWSSCAKRIIRRFLLTHHAGDTSCAKVPVPLFATADFPLRVADAVPGTLPPGSHASRLARKAATVAAATVIDAFKRARMGGAPIDDKALRGGTFEVKAKKGSQTLVARLNGARFAKDLQVTGGARWTAKGRLNARVTVAGKVDGRLWISGPLLVTTDDMLTVSGTLDGQRIKVRVPAT